MKKRYLYSLLFGIPGFFVAGIITLILFGVSFGILWIYVFGDNSWPASTEPILTIVLVFTFLILWMGSVIIGYGVGRKLENDPILNKMHILLSGGLTAIFILFILLQPWSVGRLGPKSDSVLCSDYCRQQGYSASGMPPLNSGDRTCSCYDSSGDAALEVPLDRIHPGSSR